MYYDCIMNWCNELCIFNLIKFINLAANSQKTLVSYKDQLLNAIYEYKDNKTGNVGIT